MADNRRPTPFGVSAAWMVSTPFADEPAKLVTELTSASHNLADIRDLVHVREMKLKILEDETLVGVDEVFVLDPPMCVAMARFEPAVSYDAARHANVIDGDYVGERSDILRLEMPDSSHFKSEAISVQDFLTLDEREVHIIGIFEPSFDELFSEHPDFKAY